MKGKLTISRVHTSSSKDYISIRLRDEASFCECVDIQVSLEDFAAAVTGLSHQACNFEWNPAHVGRTAEHKKVFIPLPQAYVSPKDRATIAASVLKPFEVDGWMGRADDLFNCHHWTTQENQRGSWVSFTRYT